MRHDQATRDQAERIAGMALDFFEALLKGEAHILIDVSPEHDGSLIATKTRISLEWDRKAAEEMV